MPNLRYSSLQQDGPPASFATPQRLSAVGSIVDRTASFFSKSWSSLRPTRNRVPHSRKTWAEKRKEIVVDLHRANCKGLLKQSVCIGIVLGLIGAVYALSAGIPFDTSGVCLPNGQFAIYNNTYNRWAPSGFFQITLGFGSLPFSKVKVIDIVWDVVVGRGGQVVLALVSYKVYTMALLRLMERNPVSYGTFEAIMLQGSSLSAIFQTSRDFFLNQGPRAKATVLWMTISAAFAIAFPTMVSAMTGYSATVEAVVTVNGTFIPFSDFQMVRYVIHDGDRVPGLSKDYLVTSSRDAKGSSLRSDSWLFDTCAGWGPWSYNDAGDIYLNWTQVPTECMLEWRVSQYTMTYGFFGHNDTNSTFNNGDRTFRLSAPSLNISAFSADYSCFWGPGSSFDPTMCFFGAGWQDPRSHEYPFKGPDNVAFTISNSNDKYDINYIKANGVCQQLSTYQWGFSFLLLFVFMLLTAVWALGTYVLWRDAYLNSRLDRASRDMGTLRAVLDYAATIKKDLGTAAADDIGDKQLKAQIGSDRKRYMIGYESLSQMDLPLSRSAENKIWWQAFNVRAWAKQEKWLLTSWSFSLAGIITIAGFSWIPGFSLFFVLYLPPLCLMYGATMTMLAGRSQRSRTSIFFCFTLLGLPLLFLDDKRDTQPPVDEHET